MPFVSERPDAPHIHSRSASTHSIPFLLTSLTALLRRSFLLLFFFGVAVSTGTVRLKRFLNAEVHNRIDVLPKSHEDHQEQTSLLRNIIFGSTITLSALLLLSIIGLLTLCIRFRRHRRPFIVPR